MKKLTSKEDVSSLLTAAGPSIALGAAIETGLLELLSKGPMTGKQLSTAMNIPGKRGHYWLQMLMELGILESGPNGYIPSPLARSVVLDAEVHDRLRLKHLAEDEREILAGIRNLTLYLSEASVWKVQGLAEPKGYVEKMKEDPERAYSFTHLLYNVHQNLGQVLADLLDLNEVRNLMDVGGSSGVVSMALVRKYPNLRTTVIDLENVCAVGRGIVQENNLSDRIGFLSADFLADELPQGFDFVLHCDIGIFGVELFRKLWASLEPEGRMAVLFHFPLSEHTAPVQFLEWAFLDSLKDPNFGFPTVGEVQAQMVRAGFRLLPGDYTLPDGRILLQAEK